MAACGSLQHIFEKPLPENPTLLESLSSWKHIQSMKKSIEESSFTEIFGELHFKENPDSSSFSPIFPTSSPPSPFMSQSSLLIDSNPESPQTLDNNKNETNNNNPASNYYPTQKKHYRHGESFSSMNSESLSLCTEGLGFESSDDVEDYINNDWKHCEERISITKHTETEYLYGESKRSKISGGEFPPPISCIGKSGKPWVCFKSYRNNGRFILKEVRIPTQECLHARREDGRLKLQFIQSDDEIIEEEEEEDDDDEIEEKEENEERIDDGHDYIHDHDCDNNKEDEDNSGENNFDIRIDEIGGEPE